MSGPIVRKYGFPNFEQIFGKRELKHGADEPKATEPAQDEPSRPAPATDEAAPRPEDKKP